MHLSQHTRDPHTRQFIFSWIVFVKNKTKWIKRKLDEPVSPNSRPCQISGATSFSHFLPATSPMSISVILYIARWKNRENPNIQKNLKILWSKIYLNSLLLWKTRKYSNVVKQMQIKRQESNVQIQVKCINRKKICILLKHHAKNLTRDYLTHPYQFLQGKLSLPLIIWWVCLFQT